MKKDNTKKDSPKQEQMKMEHMKRFLNEILLYLWIPLIVALVSYIFFELNDTTLGVMTLAALSAMYALARLYLMHKKWWLLVALVVVILGSVGIYFLRVPAFSLNINNQEVKGTSLNLPEGVIAINPAPENNGAYSKNAVVILTAEPSAGYEWTGWSGTNNDDINPTTITMDDDKTVSVNFGTRYSLIINNQLVIGSFLSFPEGSVIVDPPPSSSDWKYSSGTTVNLTVHPNSGYDWTNWTGTADNYVNPTTVTMDSSKQITLTFSGRYELTINGQSVTAAVALFPEGSVLIQPPPGSDGKYASNTQVTLTASPISGYGWRSWSGTSNDISNPTTVVLNADKHVMINWDLRFLAMLNSQPITSAITFINGGMVTVDPPPASDGTYAKDTRVTFTATPSSGYRFGRWGGEVNSTATSIIVTFNSDKNVSAIFIKTYKLIVDSYPFDGGNVLPGDGTYDEGAVVNLTATAALGYRFDHWEGSIAGNLSAVTIIMDSDKDITAVFVKIFTLTVIVNPSGGGTVSISGGTFDEGTVVTITATPAAGYVFDHWEGDFTGTDATITITMNKNMNITAVFVASP